MHHLVMQDYIAMGGVMDKLAKMERQQPYNVAEILMIVKQLQKDIELLKKELIKPKSSASNWCPTCELVIPCGCSGY